VYAYSDVPWPAVIGTPKPVTCAALAVPAATVLARAASSWLPKTCAAGVREVEGEDGVGGVGAVLMGGRLEREGL
jgi:hypothetical protein